MKNFYLTFFKQSILFILFFTFTNVLSALNLTSNISTKNLLPSNNFCEPGTPCDDGDDNTVFDIRMDDCSCLGVPSNIESLCNEVVIEVTNDNIYVSGLGVTPLARVEIFNIGRTKVYECSENCLRTEGYLNAPNGRYRVYIELMDLNGNVVCETEKFVFVDHLTIGSPGGNIGTTTGGDISSHQHSFITKSKKSQSALQIYPNPAAPNTPLNIQLSQLEEKATVVSIFDSYGRLMIQKRSEGVAEIRHEIDLSRFPNGTYFINLEQEGSSVISKKLMVLSR